MKTNISWEIEDHLVAASNLASQEVERLARKLLRSSKKIGKFTTAMGTFFITHADGSVMWDHEARMYKGFRDIEDFIIKYDSELHITGEPMSFTATGPKITDW